MKIELELNEEELVELIGFNALAEVYGSDRIPHVISILRKEINRAILEADFEKFSRAANAYCENIPDHPLIPSRENEKK